MGKLEVVFRIHLAYPLILLLDASAPPAVGRLESGSTVYIEPVRSGRPGEPQGEWGPQLIRLRVERQCSDEEGAKTSYADRLHLGVDRDAALALWQLFEAIRESALRRNNTVCTYPVVPAESLASNPLVKGYELEWIYEGRSLASDSYTSGLPAIEITPELWGDAVRRLGEKQPLPVYWRLASDAFYFAEHDPPRAIIMAAAAWETALRSYLRGPAAERDAAYRVASNSRGLRTLYEFAKAARGGRVFHDVLDCPNLPLPGTLESARVGVFEGYRALTEERLPSMRNRLMHQGEAKLPGGVAVDYALAVAAAIEWLFSEE